VAIESQRSSQEQFGRTAANYAISTTHSSNDSLVDLRELLEAEGRRFTTGVDVGTGPGFTAFAIAPYCEHVIATDVTPQMLEEVRRLRHERDAPSTQMALAAAESLPFADGSIDLVTCRTAAHHFVNLARWLREVARVLSPGGLLIVADTCAPEDAESAAWMHDIELRRDASHIKNLAPSEWHAAIEEAGLSVKGSAMSYVLLQYPDWADRAGMSEADSTLMRADLLRAPAGAQRAFDFQENDDKTIDFHWDVVAVSAVKR
jgi:ubiquinone/menaquinone biosynthesis C-methylase UbiE